MNRIEIASDGTPNGTHVKVDGKPLDNIVSIELDVGVERRMLATVTMRCYVDDLNVDGHALVEMPTRAVARMTDVEVLERAMCLLGEVGMEKVLRYAAELCAEAILTFNEERA